MYFERPAPFHPAIPQLLNRSRLLSVPHTVLTGSSLLAPPFEAALLLSSRSSLPLFLSLSPDFYATGGLSAAVERTGLSAEGEAVSRNGLVNC